MDNTITYTISLRGGEASAATAKKIGGEVEALGGKMRRVGSESEKAAKHTGALGGSLKHLAVGLGAVGAGYAAWSAAKGAISYTADLAKSTRTLSKATGLTVGQSSKLVAVSGALGVESNKLGMVFAKLGKATIAQSEATGKHVTAFDRLGISQAEAKAHLNDTGGMLDLVTRKLATEHIPAAEKAALMTELFGKGWQSLGPLLLEGEAGLGKLTKAAKTYGLEISGKGGAAQKQLHEQMLESTLAMDGLKKSFAETAAGPLGKLLNGFAKLANYARKGEWGKFDGELERLSRQFETVAEKALPKIAEGFAKIAPKVALAFVKGFTHANLGGQLVLAGVLASKLGLTGPIFKSLGGRLMKSMTKGMVATEVVDAAGVTVAGSFAGAFIAALPAALAAGGIAAVFSAFMSPPTKTVPVNKFDKNFRTGTPIPHAYGGEVKKTTYGYTAKDLREKEHRETAGGYGATAKYGPGRVPELGGKPAHGATGGTITSPGLIEVGERGPEIVHLPQGAMIDPLKPGSLAAKIDLHVHLDGKDIAHSVRRQTLQSQAAGA